MDKKLEAMMMAKKPKEKMSEQEIQAKMDVLLEMLQMISEEMGGRVKNGMMDHENEMKKVSVVAPSNEGLEEGLEEAQEVIPDMPEEDEMPSMVQEDPVGEPVVEDEEENPFAGAKKKTRNSFFED